jgi:hypothetical protein
MKLYKEFTKIYKQKNFDQQYNFRIIGPKIIQYMHFWPIKETEIQLNMALG